MNHRIRLVPRSHLSPFPFHPNALLDLFHDAVGFEPVARQLAFPVDIQVSDRAYTLKVDTPGVTRDRIALKAENDRLTLAIEREASAEAETDTFAFHRQERWRVHGERQFRLPEDTLGDQITATLEQGVLTITVPRRPPVKPQVHTIIITEGPAHTAAVAPTTE
jgi:HSP20 family molecular chaperone IbpA